MKNITKTLLISLLGIALSSCTISLHGQSTSEETSSSTEVTFSCDTESSFSLYVGEEKTIQFTCSDYDGQMNNYMDWYTDGDEYINLQSSGWLVCYKPGNVVITATIKESFAQSYGIEPITYTFNLTILERTDEVYTFFTALGKRRTSNVWDYYEYIVNRSERLNNDQDLYIYKQTISYSPSGDAMAVEYSTTLTHTETNKSSHRVDVGRLEFNWGSFKEGKFIATWEVNRSSSLEVGFNRNYITFDSANQTISLTYDKKCVSKGRGNANLDQVNLEVNVMSWFEEVQKALAWLNSVLQENGSTLKVFE